jgi:hypothetical protein
VALLVLDGLSLADWLLVRPVWQARQPGWQIQEWLLLAQIPTITAVSRQALVSGWRPADFAATLDHNHQEPKQWAAFWQGHDAPASAYERLRLDEGDRPAALSSARVQALCLINNDIDEMLHGASLGAAAVQAALRLWLQSRLPALEAAIIDLLGRGYVVYLASDHGHTEAVGMGQPAEGLAVQTRSKRARLYRDRRLAQRVQQAFPGTMLWASQGLLPADAWILLPPGRQAFAPQGTVVVSHGGPTIDEVVVPLVRIEESTGKEESRA